MTLVEYKENGKEIELNVSGHSGYAESGADIVCSAISVLIHSFCQALFEFEDGVGIEIHEVTMLDGYVNVQYRDAYGYSYPMLKMLKVGFTSIQEEYKSYISVTWGEKS